MNGDAPDIAKAPEIFRGLKSKGSPYWLPLFLSQILQDLLTDAVVLTVGDTEVHLLVIPYRT